MNEDTILTPRRGWDTTVGQSGIICKATNDPWAEYGSYCL